MNKNKNHDMKKLCQFYGSAFCAREQLDFAIRNFKKAWKIEIINPVIDSINNFVKKVGKLKNKITMKLPYNNH